MAFPVDPGRSRPDEAVAPRWLTPAGVATYAGVSVRTVRCWASLGHLVPSRHGRVVRFDRVEVDAFMRAGKGEAAEVRVLPVPLPPSAGMRTVGRPREGARRAS